MARAGAGQDQGRAAVQPQGRCRLWQQHPCSCVFCLGEAGLCEPAAAARPQAPGLSLIRSHAQPLPAAVARAL